LIAHVNLLGTERSQKNTRILKQLEWAKASRGKAKKAGREKQVHQRGRGGGRTRSCISGDLIRLKAITMPIAE
jgi:hypothetical protein